MTGKKLTLFLLVMILGFAHSSSGQGKVKSVEVMNSTFYRNIIRVAPVVRDAFLDKKRGSFLQGRGVIKSVEHLERYKRSTKIELHDSDAAKYGLTIKYFLFTSNKGWFKDAIVGETFEFKGQCMVITPLNSRRNAYIFDIVLEDGAILVQ